MHRFTMILADLICMIYKAEIYISTITPIIHDITSSLVLAVIAGCRYTIMAHLGIMDLDLDQCSP